MWFLKREKISKARAYKGGKIKKRCITEKN
jgi:hypothetical protein